MSLWEHQLWAQQPADDLGKGQTEPLGLGLGLGLSVGQAAGV